MNRVIHRSLAIAGAVLTLHAPSSIFAQSTELDECVRLNQNINATEFKNECGREVTINFKAFHNEMCTSGSRDYSHVPQTFAGWSGTRVAVCIEYKGTMDRTNYGYENCEEIADCPASERVIGYGARTASPSSGNIVLAPAAGTLEFGEGGSGKLEINLSAAPAYYATVFLSKTNSNVNLDKTSLIFTPSNYSEEQEVTVTSDQDDDSDDISDTITLKVSGGLTASEVTKAVTVMDDDIPSGNIVLSSSETLALDEGGSTGTFAVRLDVSPTPSAVLSVMSGDTGAVTVSPATLTFSDSNYDTAQMVTVTGAQDSDGTDESATITLSVSSGYAADDVTKTVSVTDDDGSIEISAAAVTAIEGGTAGTFTVKLGAPPASSATLSVTSGDMEAVTVSPSTLTFSASNYDTVQTVTVTGVADEDGTDDSATITLAVSGSGYTASNATKTITVTDDDGAIELSSAAVSLVEGGSPDTFTVKLGAAPASSVTLSVTSGDTGAVTVSPSTLTFSATDYGTERTVTVTPVGDSDGTNESVPIDFEVSGGGYTASDVTKTITVTDGDGGIVVSSAAVTAIEGGSAGTFTVKLAAPPASSAVLSVTSGDTGAATVSPSMLTFSASNYDTAQTVTVTGDEDSDGTDESVTITLSVSSGYAADDVTKTVSVTDDDGSIELGSGAVTVIEDGTAGTFTVKLGAPPASSAELSVTISDTGAATVSPATLTFTASDYDTGQPVTVTGVADEDGTDDSATITLAVSSSGYTASNATKTITVTDDDGAIELSSSAAVSLVEGGSPDTFTVKLGAPPASSATLSVTSGDTGAVTVSPATLTFSDSNYAEARTVTVTPVGDSDGTNESVPIDFEVSGGGYTASDATKTITVTDGDGGIVVSSAAVTAIEGGRAGTFTVTLAAPPASSAVLSVTSGDTGTATVSPATLTFSDSNYDTGQTVTVTAAQDSDGTDDSATITLSVSSGYAASDATKAVAVEDDDGGIVVSSAAVSLIEGGSAGTFTVKLAAPPTSSALLSVRSEDTTVGTVSPATLTFSSSNYDTAQTVTISAVEDDDGTDDASGIELSITSGYRADDASKAFEVEDDDGTIELSSSAAVSLVEGGSADTFTVKLGAPPASSATLSVTSGDRLSVTVSPATLTFSPSNYDTPQTVSVYPADDSDDNDESTTITVAAVSGYTASEVTKPITVTDDDGAIEVGSEAVSLVEGGSAGTFTVTLSEPPISSATLLVISGDTDVVTVLPPTLTFSSSNYATPQTVTVTAMDDDDGTDDSTLITLATTAGYMASNVTKAITVVDDDGSIEIDAEETDAEETDAEEIALIEGGITGTFAVRLAVPPASSATLSVTSGDIGAVTVSPGTLTFSPSNYATSQMVTLTPLYDVDETDEELVITLAVVAGYTASDATKRVIVKDDDGKIEVSAKSISLTEGGSVGTFTVKLASAPASSAAIGLTNGDSGAVTISPTTLTFTPSNYATAQTVTLTAIEDEDGTDESVAIVLTSSDAYPASGLSSTVEVIDDDGEIEVSDDAVEITEGGSPGTLTVTLAVPPASSATVSVKSDDPQALMVSPETLTFAHNNYDEAQTVTLTPVEDADADAESVAITLSATAGYRASDTTKNVVVNDDEVDGSIVLAPAGSLTIDEGGSVIFTVRLDTRPMEDATITLSNVNEDIRLSPTSLSFGPDDWDQERIVLVIADPDHDAMSETDTITLVAEGGLVAASRTKAVSITDGLSGGLIVVRPAQRLLVDEGGSVVLLIALGARPEADTTVSLSNPGEGLIFSSSSLHFERAHWNRSQTVTVGALGDDDAIDESEVIVLSAEDFPERRVIVDVKDGTDPLPTRARTLALPPSSVSDDATLRVRCKEDTPCLVFLDCTAQEDGSIFEGWIHDPIPAYGTRTLTAADIESYTGGGSWSGKGRLGCALRSEERISAQVWTRSGDGVLVNNSAVIRSVPELRGHRADIESIPSPDGPEESNLRIRCLAPEGLDCTRAGFSCFDDEGTRYDVGLGAIGRLTVYHMQSEELAARIGHRWTGLGLSCEFRSDHPFTVQVMTRTGGGGALVNNSATGEMPR